MCRGARLEASGLSRGAAQSPWFSHVGARKRNHARPGSTICSDAADPSPDALAAPRRKRILQCTQAAHGLSPTLAQAVSSMTRIPSILFGEHIWHKCDSFCTAQYTYLKPVALLSPLPPFPVCPPSASCRSSNLSSFLFSFTCTNRRTNARSATMRQITVFAVPPGMYRGAAVAGYIYEP